MRITNFITIRLLFILSVLLIAMPSSAQVDFSRMISFGDSLTHNDILGAVYDHPQDLYGQDPFEAMYSKGAVEGDNLRNFAIAGSVSANMGFQIFLYQFYRNISDLPPATLIGFEIGGNDVLNNRHLLKAHYPGTYFEADDVIDELIANIKESMLWLYETNPGSRFIIWTIPDVTLTPSVMNNSFSPEELDNIQAHIQRANADIRRAMNHPDILIFDLYTFIQEFVTDPPEIMGQQLIPPPLNGQYDHLFADSIHPTAVANALIANAIIDDMSEKWQTDIAFFSMSELAEMAHVGVFSYKH